MLTGSWSTPIVVQTITSAIPQGGRIFVDRFDKIHIAFVARESDSSTKLRYVTDAYGGSLAGNAIAVNQGPALISPSLTGDASGETFILFGANSSVSLYAVHGFFNQTGPWALEVVDDAYAENAGSVASISRLIWELP